MVKAAVKIKYNKYLGIGRVNMIRQSFRNIFNKNKKTFTHVFSLKLLGEKRAKANAAAEAAGRRRASDDFLAAGS
jgi:hypothetical protein